MADKEKASPPPDGMEEDPMAEAFDLLSQTDAEEIEAMSQVGDDDDVQPFEIDIEAIDDPLESEAISSPLEEEPSEVGGNEAKDGTPRKDDNSDEDKGTKDETLTKEENEEKPEEDAKPPAGEAATENPEKVTADEESQMITPDDKSDEEKEKAEIAIKEEGDKDKDEVSTKEVEDGEVKAPAVATATVKPKTEVTEEERKTKSDIGDEAALAATKEYHFEEEKDETEALAKETEDESAKPPAEETATEIPQKVIDGESQPTAALAARVVEASSSEQSPSIRRTSNPKLTSGLRKIATMDEAEAKTARESMKSSSKEKKGRRRRQTMTDAALRQSAISKTSGHRLATLGSQGSIQSMASDDTPIAGNTPTGKSHYRKKKRITKTKSMEEQAKEAVGEETLKEYHKRVNALLQEYFGFIVDEEKYFEELGLGSAKEVELTNQVAKTLGVTLPYHYMSEFCATPAIFRTYVVSRMAMNETIPVPVELRKSATPNQMHSKYKITWPTLGILQTILSVVILLLCTVSLIPLWFLYDVLAEHQILSLMVPMYFVCNTTVVVLAKWLVVGQYKPATLTVPSTKFLQWWFVDRLVHIWEVWVGRFLLDTPWLAWVYVLMGANISLSCNLKGFIREFDLITMEKYATLDHPCTHAMQFTSWEDYEAGPTMILKPIFVGKKSKVRGMLSPGVHVGKRVWVERLSVVEQGAHIPDKHCVAGNPAVVTSSEPKKMLYYGWGLVGLLKTIWMFLDLWVFYSLGRFSDWATTKLVGEVAGWGDWLHVGSRDHWIYQWTGVRTSDQFQQDFTIWFFLCFLFVYSISMLLSSVIIKFLMIGYRTPGRAREYFWQNFVDWAADYHYSIAILLFQIVASHSRLSNVILMMHGMQIDMASKTNLATFKPSQLDLIRLRRSYVQHCTFDVKKDGQFRRTLLKDCSVGYRANLGPGLIANGAVIAPLSFVTEDIDREMLHASELVNSWSLYLHELLNLLLYCLFIMFFYVALLPAYEYWMFFHKTISAVSSWLVMSGSMAILAYTWALVLLILQSIALCGASEDRPRPWSMSFYNVYQSFLCTFQEWTIAWHILYGTQLFNDMVRLLGVKVHGRALLFARRYYDFSFLMIEDKTVLDRGARISGNNTLYDHVQLGPSVSSGLVYDGSVVMANGVAASRKTGPWRAVVQTSQAFIARGSLHHEGSQEPVVETV